MPTRVRVLDNALVDQIAAGEVVERPASVVKELIENAIDAGATSLSIQVQEGGREMIRVTDDGSGMEPEDARLAMQRHATSKIRAFDDLASLRTLGFRGEALPSIAAVSRFELTTRPPHAVAGTKIRIEGGERTDETETGCAPGTTVEVRELFYNVPARLKFLKSAQTENGHIGNICLRVALAHPHIRLTLDSNGKRVREYLPAPDALVRAQRVFRDEHLSNLEFESPIASLSSPLKLRAALGAPERARSGTRSLLFFVNGRPVTDHKLARAVAFAYGSVIPPGRYPVGVVHLDIDPGEVDVNVHPQKSEVRFTNERAVLDALTRNLAGKLGLQPWGRSTTRSPDFWDRRIAKDQRITTDAASPDAVGRSYDAWGIAQALAKSNETGVAERPATPYAATAAPSLASSDATQPGRLIAETGFFKSLRVLAQVRRMLIVCEGDDGVYFIDQHAADERRLYHRMRQNHAANDIAKQRLLFAERVELERDEAALVEEHEAVFSRAGLETTRIGETTVAVHSVPVLLSRASGERLLRDLIGELLREADRSFGDAVDMALATMACHAAIRAGDELSIPECEALLGDLDDIDSFATHCPHGRPIAHHVSFADIERRLGR